MRRRKQPPWFHDFRKRLLFEGPATAAYPDLEATKHGKGWKADYVYTATINVPDYEARRVRLIFAASREVLTPTIYANGPGLSPHRYRGGSLCVWEPDDLDDRRWLPSDGLRALLDMVAIHLFKEAWWRETGEWLGDQHIQLPGKEAA